MNEKEMNMLPSKGEIPYFKSKRVNFCESCVHEKQNKIRFVKMGQTP